MKRFTKISLLIVFYFFCIIELSAFQNINYISREKWCILYSESDRNSKQISKLARNDEFNIIEENKLTIKIDCYENSNKVWYKIKLLKDNKLTGWIWGNDIIEKQTKISPIAKYITEETIKGKYVFPGGEAPSGSIELFGSNKLLFIGHVNKNFISKGEWIYNDKRKQLTIYFRTEISFWRKQLEHVVKTYSKEEIDGWSIQNINIKECSITFQMINFEIDFFGWSFQKVCNLH
jgi:hypothetical protein